MIRSILSLLIVATLAGCGGGAKEKKLPPTENVTGVITLDGKPVSGAVVTFLPMNDTPGVECVGRTDESGKYEPQQTRGAKGVPQGTYKVTVSRFMKGGKPLDPNDEGGGGAGGVVAESLPARFSSPTNTTLFAKVEAGGGTFDFKVTSK